MISLTYDPAIAANVISVIALLVAGLSYRHTKRTEDAKRRSNAPEVTPSISAMTDAPQWFVLHLEARNHFQTDLYLMEIRLISPRRAIGFTAAEVDQPDNTGNVIPILPEASGARRRLQLTRMKMGPAGSTRGLSGAGAAEKLWTHAYVWLPASTEEVRFDVVLSSRLTDIRRVDRHVSKQKVSVPAKHRS